MKAILCSQYCQPDDLVLADVPDPVAEPGQAVIAIKAAALNFFDILMIQGKYQIKPPLPYTPGSDGAEEDPGFSLTQEEVLVAGGMVIAGVVLWISNSETIGGVSSALVDPVSSWKLLGLPLAALRRVERFVFGTDHRE